MVAWIVDMLTKGFAYEHIGPAWQWLTSAPTDCCNTLQSGDLQK